MNKEKELTKKELVNKLQIEKEKHESKLDWYKDFLMQDMEKAINHLKSMGENERISMKPNFDSEISKLINSIKLDLEIIEKEETKYIECVEKLDLLSM